MDNKNYNELSDTELITMIKSDDTAALDFLLNRHKKLVTLKARAYFIMGADRDDIIQEGMIGLYKAVRDYDGKKNVSFAAFADLCVERQILTAIKTASRQKHSPLNSYVSLSADDFCAGNEIFFEHALKQRRESPEELLINREAKSLIESGIDKTLSGLERKVLSMYFTGASYGEIADALKKNEKAIDNAIQRIRRKMGRILTDIDISPTGKKAAR